MKRQVNPGTKAVRRTLWRNTLMGIIGLTMSACGISEDGTYERIEHRAADIVSAQADATTLSMSEKEKEIDALKEQLEILQKRVAEVEAIEPPTLQLPLESKLQEPAGVTTDRNPGKLTVHEVDGDIGIVGSAMALGVEKRVPLGVGTTFGSDAEKVWAFIKVKNKKAPTKLRMVWKRHGKERMAIDLRVGKSSGWRTWSYKRISKHDAGEWTVDVLTQDGKTIHTMAFEIADGQAQADLAHQ